VAGSFDMRAVQAMVDAIDAFAVVCGLDATILMWNQRCEELSGVPLADVAGRSLWDVLRLRSNLLREAQTGFQQLASGQIESLAFHSQWTRKDRHRTRLAWAARLVKVNERPALIVATGRETTRGRAARQLEETEARFAALMDLLPDPIVIHQDGLAVFVNQAALRLYGGRSPADILGRPVITRVAPEARPLVASRLQLLGEGQAVPFVTERHLRMDGTPIEVEVAASPVVFEGRPAVELVVRDLSVRNAADAALRESEARMRSLLEAAPIVVFATSRDGITTSVFGRVLEVLGRPAESLIGHDIFEISAHSSELREGFRRALAGEFVVTRMRHMGRVVESRLSPLLGPDGAPGGMIGVATDVTESAAAEAAWAESEARMRAVFDESPLGMMLIDQGWHAVECNRALQRLLGFNASELAAVSVLDYTLPADRDRLGRNLRDLFAGRILSFEDEERWTTKDGSEAWMRVHVSPVRELDGPIRLAVGMVEDISDHMLLEEQLRQASKMEALGRLAGGVAHDFNNLLTVVSGYADLLAASLEGDERAADVAEIRKAASRAAELTAQLLAFGRRAPRSLERIDLNSRIGAMVPMLRRLLGEDIDFEVSLHPGVGTIEVDPSQFDQVVMNLVVNARDAMPGGGKLELTTGRVDGVAGNHGRKGAWARIRIADSGVGIATEVMDHIFEPFFTTKEQGRGTGLGLAMVYGIVQQIGGRIGVESSVGVGSTFVVDLPLCKGLPEIEDAQPAATNHQGNETVLLVEDEPAVREFCRRALEAEGYAVVTAGPSEAMAEAARLGLSLDVLVTDVVMPELDGPTVAAVLHAGLPTLKVLFMSGYPRDREHELGGAEAAGAVLVKPFSARELCDAVRRTLDRTVAREPRAASSRPSRSSSRRA
jgi:PAS domain S-box-containing protein